MRILELLLHSVKRDRSHKLNFLVSILKDECALVEIFHAFCHFAEFAENHLQVFDRFVTAISTDIGFHATVRILTFEDVVVEDVIRGCAVEFRQF